MKTSDAFWQFLPEGLNELFEMVRFEKTDQSYDIWLDEKKILSDEDYRNPNIVARGYTDYVTIQDYPMRGRPVYLHLRKNKWWIKACHDRKKRWKLTDESIIEKAESLMQIPGRYHLGINQLNGDGHVIVAERMQDGTLICFDTQQQEFVALKDWQGYQYIEVLKVDGLIFNTSVLSKLVRKI